MAFSAVTLGAVVSGLFLAVQRPVLFDPYFGGIPPILALAAICSCGWVALKLLDGNGYFVLSRRGFRRRGIAVAACYSIPFMALVTVADLAEGFPKDINVPPPDSLLLLWKQFFSCPRR